MTPRSMIIALALTASLSLAHDDLLGRWSGALGPGVVDLAIDVTFVRGADGLEATIDIPAQGLFAFPLGDVAHDDGAVGFVMPGVPGDPAFTGTLDGDRIDGILVQGGQPLPFFLERSDDAASRRPQEPRAPFPYDEEEVTFESGDVTLAGTITLPSEGGPVPALVLITGSGAQDRDETIAGHKPFLVLADHLTRAGYAVLRVDDRGVDGSTGDDAQATFDDLASDVRAGVALLAAHPRVDASRIGLLGHSQGGYLAPAVAADDDAVAFVILLAAPAVRGFDVLVLQNERIVEAAMRAQVPSPPDDIVDTAVAAQIAFLEALLPRLEREDWDGARALVRSRIEEELALLPAEGRPTEAQLAEITRVQADAVATPVFRAFVIHDPQPTLRRLTVPTLAIFGGLDIQVDAEQNAGPMREALEAAGNADATVETFPGLNHLMQPAVTGDLDEYGLIETTIDPEVLVAITAWLDARTVRR